MDPLAPKYPYNSPYAFSENVVINAIELEGAEKLYVNGTERTKAATKVSITAAEADFGFKRPSVAKRIGAFKSGSTNISSVAARTARHIAKDNLSVGEGTERNAVRHVIWSATINSKWGETINLEATNSHEGISIWGTALIDLNQPFEGDMALADHIVDLLNNNIGRNISQKGDGQSNFEIAAKTLGVFYTEGLYTATRDDDGTIDISRTKITSEQYAQALRVLIDLNEHGFDPNEQKQIEKGETVTNDDAY